MPRRRSERPARCAGPDEENYKFARHCRAGALNARRAAPGRMSRQDYSRGIAACRLRTPGALRRRLAGCRPVVAESQTRLAVCHHFGIRVRHALGGRSAAKPLIRRCAPPSPEQGAEVPQAGEGKGIEPRALPARERALPAREGRFLPPLPRAGEGWGEGACRNAGWETQSPHPSLRATFPRKRRARSARGKRVRHARSRRSQRRGLGTRTSRVPAARSCHVNRSRSIHAHQKPAPAASSDSRPTA